MLSQTELEEELQRSRVTGNYLVPVESVSDGWDKEAPKVIIFYLNNLLRFLFIQDSSSMVRKETYKNLNEKKEYRSKYLASKLESSQKSLKRYRFVGKIYKVIIFTYIFCSAMPSLALTGYIDSI